MQRHIKAFDKSKHSVSIGSCVPGPMWKVLPVLPTIFPDFTISSDLKDLEELEAGFENDTYQIIFMPYKSHDKNIVSKEILHEALCFYLHESHRLANKKTLSMKELDGETMLLFSQIGFWHSLPKEKMPNSNFLMQDERYTFSELVKASTIPAFTSNIAKPAYPNDEGRVIIPIEDKEASVTFYLWYKERDKNKFQPLWNSLYL